MQTGPKAKSFGRNSANVVADMKLAALISFNIYNVREKCWSH